MDQKDNNRKNMMSLMDSEALDANKALGIIESNIATKSRKQQESIMKIKEQC